MVRSLGSQNSRQEAHRAPLSCNRFRRRTHRPGCRVVPATAQTTANGGLDAPDADSFTFELLQNNWQRLDWAAVTGATEYAFCRNRSTRYETYCWDEYNLTRGWDSSGILWTTRPHGDPPLWGHITCISVRAVTREDGNLSKWSAWTHVAFNIDRDGSSTGQVDFAESCLTPAGRQRLQQTVLPTGNFVITPEQLNKQMVSPRMLPDVAR